MINPIALITMGLGVLLLLFGLFLLLRRVKTAGIIVALLGLAIAAVPFIVTLYVRE